MFRSPPSPKHLAITVTVLVTFASHALGQTLEYATFLGGDRDDRIRQMEMVLDPSGPDAVIVFGETEDFEGPSGTVTGTFVAEVFLDGSAPHPAWITEFSGGFILGSAVDAAGNIYASGHTAADERFVTKFDSLGNQLYHTVLGTAHWESLHDTTMAVDDLGHVFLAHAIDNGTNGKDVSVAMFTDTGTSLQLEWGVVFGGTGKDKASAVGVDDSGHVWVAGVTESDFPDPNFPMVNGFRTVRQATREVFVARLDATAGGQIVYSTLVAAGTAPDVEVDSLGRVYVTGSTGPIAGLIPPAGNGSPFGAPFDASHNGDDDAYLAIIDGSQSGTSSQLYGTYLGGSGRERGRRLAIDGNGRVTLAMDTGSTDLPTTPGSYDATYNGGQSDAYFARIDPMVSGSGALDVASYLGGSRNEEFTSVGLDSTDRIAIVLRSHSKRDFDPTTTISNAADDAFDGNSDVVVTRFEPPAPPPPGVLVSPTSGLVTDETGGTDTFSVVLETQPTDPVDIDIVTSDPSEGRFSTAVGEADSITLTFDTTDWSTAQTVTVVGQDDTEPDGNVAYDLVTGSAVSVDPAYSGLAVDDVSAINLDDDQVGPTTMSVSSIELSLVDIGKGQKKGRAVVTIVDDQGGSVPNATVQGTFTGDVTGTTTGTTGSDGKATLDSPTSNKGNLRFTFCVDDVTGTLVYDPANNVETCESR